MEKQVRLNATKYKSFEQQKASSKVHGGTGNGNLKALDVKFDVRSQFKRKMNAIVDIFIPATGVGSR